VNTNTKYNSAAAAKAGIFGMRAIARYLSEELSRLDAASQQHLGVAG